MTKLAQYKQATATELTPAIEDYLRAVYKLARRNLAGQNVTTTQLSERLGLRPASVTVMVQRLAAADPPLLNYHKHQGVSLTPAGELAALGVVRHHRLLEQYLHEKLGYSWDEVHDEADRLEHAISDIMAARMSAAMGNPTHDPHGHAIPAEDLSVSPSTAVSLDQIAVSSTVTIQYVRDEDPAVLRYLDQIGLRPEVQINVVAVDPANDAITVAVDRAAIPIRVDYRTAAQVFVRDEGR